MERGELELLIYLITSAQGLPGEPRIYGSIRLTEAAYKLCRILLEREPENAKLKALAERLEQDKGQGAVPGGRFLEYAAGCVGNAGGMYVDTRKDLPDKNSPLGFTQRAVCCDHISAVS